MTQKGGNLKNKIIIKINHDKQVIKLAEHFRNLLIIGNGMKSGILSHYQKLGLEYADVPEVVGITGACENVDTLFKVNNRGNIPLFFTQTGQLSLEQALQSFHGVHTVIHSGRDEVSEDARHLRQFLLTEEEFDCTLARMSETEFDEERMFTSLLDHIEKAIQAMIAGALVRGSGILTKTYGRNIALLHWASGHKFPRITYEEATGLLNRNGFADLRFGEDLASQHEAKIIELVQKKGQESPVFITKYPKEIKFFNMKVSEKDPRVVLSADLIFPFSGEGTGSAVREPDFVKLNERLLTSSMYKLHEARGGKYEDFKWYLDIVKNKLTLPHAGYGIGNERVLQYILGAADIRDVSLFSLLNKQTGDWDKVRKEQPYSLMSHKKAILLTIGKISNKRKLWPSIKNIRESHYLLCATEKTHAFLKKHGIVTTLVYKISQTKKKPNLHDLLSANLFDIIINIPTGKSKGTAEFTDGAKIRRMAVESGTTLVTDVEVAKILLGNLASKLHA